MSSAPAAGPPGFDDHRPPPAGQAAAAGDAGALEQVFELAPDLLCLLDAEGCFTRANRAWLTLLGVEPSELAALDLLDWVHPADQGTWHTMRERLCAGVVPPVAELRLRHREQGYRWFSWNVMPVPSSGQLFGVGREIHRQKQAEASLERLGRAVEATADAVLITDPAGTIVEVNPAFEAITGYAPEDVVGLNPRLLKSGQQPASWYHAMWSTLLAGSVWRGDVVNRRKDGTVYRAELTISPFYNEDRQLAGYVGVQRDVTAERQARDEQDLLNRELGLARDAAELANRTKAEFVATVSHELRTPMNGIIGMTSLLLDTVLDDEQREYATAVAQCSDTLLRLLNEILDFSRLEAGRLSIDSVDLQPAELAKSVTDLFRPQTVAKDLALACRVAPEVPAVVCGDPSRVRQVLVNLLSNAVKFTEAGSITVELDAEPPAGGQVAIWFRVRDTGCGIPEDLQAQLFEPFTQADSSSTRRYGGAGLGLSICRRLVALMGGEGGLTSHPGEGSEFWFRIPFATSDEALLAGAGGPAPGVRRFAGRVLVVEDNTVNQAVAQRYLERVGCTVTVAVDGSHAVEAWAAGQYDLILMDCHLPRLDGYEATRLIRSREAGGARIPIIALTASAMAGARERCLAAGMDDYLTKPLEAERLAEALGRWLPAADAASGEAPLIDPTVLGDLLRIDDDPEFIDDLLGVYVTQLETVLAALDQGLASGDAGAVGDAAHRLKGSSRNVGAVVLAAWLQQLEDAGTSRDLPRAAQLRAQLDEPIRQTLDALRLFRPAPGAQPMTGEADRSGAAGV